MKADWLANVDGQEYGPYTWQQMLQMATEGRVPPDLPIKRVQDKKWYKAAQVPGLVAPAKTAPAAAAVSAASAKKKDDSSHLKRAKPLHETSGTAPPEVSPPPPPPARGTEPPLAAASAPPGGGGFPVIITDAPRKSASHAAAGQPAEHAPRRKSLLVVGIMTGIAAVVLLGGGVIVWIAMSGGFAPSGTRQIAAAPQQKAEPSEQSPEGPASELSPATVETETKDESSPTKIELSAQEKTVRSIARWNSLAVHPAATVSNATIRVTRVWRADAPADDQAKTPEKKLVCVEVAISNKSRSPLKYRGWNSYGENGAILADEAKKVLPLVPISETPGMSRLIAGSVPGGGSITEVLVFEAPASEDEVLHLVLPYGVFYANVKPSPYRALELTPDIFGADLAAAPAPARANETEENLRDAIAGASLDNPPPAPGSDAARTAPGEPKPAEKGKESKPPSLKDIINNDPSPPAKTDDPPAAKSKDAKEKGKQPEPAKKPENPFEPKDAPQPAAGK